MPIDLSAFKDFAKNCRREGREFRKEVDALREQAAQDVLDGCKDGDYDDQEGKLRASFNRGDAENIYEASGDQITVGSSVYYAIMVDEGHVIGVRAKGHSHRKGAKGNYAEIKGFAPGRHFMDKALDEAGEKLGEHADAVMTGVKNRLGL